jgi:hypothetical protein
MLQYYHGGVPLTQPTSLSGVSVVRAAIPLRMCPSSSFTLPALPFSYCSEPAFRNSLLSWIQLWEVNLEILFGFFLSKIVSAGVYLPIRAVRPYVVSLSFAV